MCRGVTHFLTFALKKCGQSAYVTFWKGLIPSLDISDKREIPGLCLGCPAYRLNTRSVTLSRLTAISFDNGLQLEENYPTIILVFQLKTDRSSVCQDISRVLWKQMTHYGSPKALTLVPCVS